MSFNDFMLNCGALFVAAFGGGFLGDLIKAKLQKDDATKELKKEIDHLKEKVDAHTEQIAIITTTLAAFAYYIMSAETQRLILQGFASPQERKAISIMFDAYKANGWNGDMDARMGIIYELPLEEEENERGTN